jgi:hypothetical protein
MRTTFNTQLAVAVVDPRTGMAAMRVSSLDLVLKTYADEKHLDVTKAVNSLPARRSRLSPVFCTRSRRKEKSGRRDSNPRHPAWEAVYP